MHDVETHRAGRVPAEWFRDHVGALALDAGARDGAVTLVERVATTRGAMPPLHSRNEDETYHVLAGEVTFFVGADVVRATPGATVVAPRGVARTYRVEAPDARWLIATRVTALERFVDFGRALARPASSDLPEWASAQDVATVEVIASANGIEILGPPGALPSDPR